MLLARQFQWVMVEQYNKKELIVALSAHYQVAQSQRIPKQGLVKLSCASLAPCCRLRSSLGSNPTSTLRMCTTTATTFYRHPLGWIDKSNDPAVNGSMSVAKRSVRRIA